MEARRAVIYLEHKQTRETVEIEIGDDPERKGVVVYVTGTLGGERVDVSCGRLWEDWPREFLPRPGLCSPASAYRSGLYARPIDPESAGDYNAYRDEMDFGDGEAWVDGEPE